MKTKSNYQRKTALEYRTAIESHYRTKYFNLFMSSYEWDGLTREEREFIMKQLWKRGNIAAFRINDDLMGFAPFAPQDWNMYGTPTAVTLINTRGVSYIPSRALKTGNIRNNKARLVDEPEVVIGYAQHSQTSIQELLDPLIAQIVDLEMCLRTNRFAQKLPIFYGITPENKNKMEDVLESVFNDELKIGVEISEVDSITSLQSNPPYIIDKLTTARDNVEKVILTLLGVDNGGKEKAERMQVDEINANNEEINDYQDAVLSNLQEWAGLVNVAFGSSITIEAKYKAVDSFHEESEEDGEGEDENARD